VSELPAGRRLSQLARIEVGELRSVGAKRAAAFGLMGIGSVLDLLTHYPRRWEDWTHVATIGELAEGSQATVVAEVARVSTRRTRARRSMVEVVLDDGEDRLTCTFFNQAWRARQLGEGMRVVAAGKVTSYRGKLQMASPRLELVGAAGDEEVPTGRIVPIYPESERAGMSSYLIARCVAEALKRAKDFADPLPEQWRARLRLRDRTSSFRSIHRPETMRDKEEARRRLAFDELWRLQVALVMRKRAAAADARGIAHSVQPADPSADLVGRFLAALPFPLTWAQQRAIAEVAGDLASTDPMHRLLQGDVGSGKTVVALAALLYGVQGGHQGALMVPTEVLAEQHFLAASGLLAGLTVPDPERLGGERPVGVALLTSRTGASERARLHEALRSGGVDVLVGTHALITEDVRFASLGVVVVDEQHRFGVDQRAALREKGSSDPAASGHDPDMLVMTATPIPRTAAMTVYGDLDYSVLDELPAGRTPVRTSWVDTPEGEEKVWAKVREELRRGRQAYVVCALVRAGGGADEAEEDASLDGFGEEDGRLWAASGAGAPGGAGAADGPNGAGGAPPRAAVEERERLAAGELSGYAVGLLHGQLPAKHKEQVMSAFRRGEIQALVATTVVEVGVDVANATVMVIEDADRFGIAQLHQLRGRVGRSAEQSWCYLLATDVTPDAEKRLQALESTTDGFELAEIDLELRGEGTVLGARQKGRNDLKLASLRRDRDLVRQARDVAEAVVAHDPLLEGNPLLADELRLFVGEEEAEYLMRG